MIIADVDTTSQPQGRTGDRPCRSCTRCKGGPKCSDYHWAYGPNRERVQGHFICGTCGHCLILHDFWERHPSLTGPHHFGNEK